MHFKVAAVQVESALGQVERNLEMHAQWIERAAREGVDLVFFPECSLTGYGVARAQEHAIDFTDEAVRAVECCARERGIAVGFGFIERVSAIGVAHVEPNGIDAPENPKLGGNLFITYEIAHDEEKLIYRKTHLGLREREVFAAGDELPVAHVRCLTPRRRPCREPHLTGTPTRCQADAHVVGVQLCWEAHIPDIASTLRAKGAQLVICPHAGGLGGARRIESWDRYLAARAFDNGMYVVACNALRRDADGGLAGGGMAAYGSDGVRIASDSSAEEGMLVVDACGPLPRDLPDDGMKHVSYFDRRRPELYL